MKKIDEIDEAMRAFFKIFTSDYKERCERAERLNLCARCCDVGKDTPATCWDRPGPTSHPNTNPTPRRSCDECAAYCEKTFGHRILRSI